ncbi:hypothetical protein IC229_03990 [Spirosoma sp. BT702]|uniref:Uncharacterized protein n=1 Tax=Spirosoma profusum TaxID=2771354 RepID=A0A926XT78_9BACT|nr:hypothetical protein [Spirosoma profusum]MBD2699784.1 hypothetical protein [Spirosoma profusum]
MSRKLNWVKEAFSREISLMQDGQVVGGMHRNGFSRDVDAFLNNVQLRFDVMGFLVQSVNIHDINANNQIIGTIEFSFGKRAELKLNNGSNYLWKRHNVLMREWDMIRENADGSPEKEIVNYDLTRRFFEEQGDITVDENGETKSVEVIILTGLFIRNYFQRRRRMAAVAAAGVASR